MCMYIYIMLTIPTVESRMKRIRNVKHKLAWYIGISGLRGYIGLPAYSKTLAPPRRWF